MQNNRQAVLFSAIGLAFSFASAAQAGVILQPVGASSSMGHYTGVAGYNEIYAIDQSGLSSSYTSGTTDFDTFASSTHTVSGGSSFTTWFSAAGNTVGNFDFALGGLQTVESFALWNDPQTAGQGVNRFSLIAGLDSSFSSPVVLGTYSAVDGLGDAANFAQVFTFAPTAASFVRLQILSNHGSTLTTGFVEGAFEVGQDNLTATPEPATLSLFAGAFLIFAVGIRRKQR